MTSLPHVLLIEDAPDVQLIVRQILGTAVRVSVTDSAAGAMQRLARETFDLVLLDVTLPDGDGFQVCAQMRLNPALESVPVIFLTGKSEPSEKVMAFALGADDYVTKPFEPAEFRARVEAKLRRARQGQGSRDVFQTNAFRVLLPQQKVFLVAHDGERDLGLSALEFKLLYFFLRHPEHVLSRDRILDEVWGRDKHVTERVVDTYVYALRRKLGAHAAHLRSVPKVGYRYQEAV